MKAVLLQRVRFSDRLTVEDPDKSTANSGIGICIAKEKNGLGTSLLLPKDKQSIFAMPLSDVTRRFQLVFLAMQSQQYLQQLIYSKKYSGHIFLSEREKLGKII